MVSKTLRLSIFLLISLIVIETLASPLLHDESEDELRQLPTTRRPTEAPEVPETTRPSRTTTTTTVAPGDTTAAPGATTAAPGATTAAPSATTAAPSATTAAPSATTAAPGATTVAPSATTADPGVTTGATTAAPGATTAAPGTTVAPPGATTADPGVTTAAPGATTVDPGATTVDPGATTETPVVTTAAAGEITTPPPPQTARQLLCKKGQLNELTVLIRNVETNEYLLPSAESRFSDQQNRRPVFTGSNKADAEWLIKSFPLSFGRDEIVTNNRQQRLLGLERPITPTCPVRIGSMKFNNEVLYAAMDGNIRGGQGRRDLNVEEDNVRGVFTNRRVGSVNDNTANARWELEPLPGFADRYRIINTRFNTYLYASRMTANRNQNWVYTFRLYNFDIENENSQRDLWELEVVPATSGSSVTTPSPSTTASSVTTNSPTTV